MSAVLDQVRNSVVKVFTQSDAPDYDQPWQTEGVASSVGSGLVVSTRRGPRVLTNAHVVENQVFVEGQLALFRIFRASDVALKPGETYTLLSSGKLVTAMSVPSVISTTSCSTWCNRCGSINNTNSVMNATRFPNATITARYRLSA